jgi:hypothetical protein
MAVWDLNSNLDVFSMQTFLRGLIYLCQVSDTGSPEPLVFQTCSMWTKPSCPIWCSCQLILINTLQHGLNPFIRPFDGHTFKYIHVYIMYKKVHVHCISFLKRTLTHIFKLKLVPSIIWFIRRSLSHPIHVHGCPFLKYNMVYKEGHFHTLYMYMVVPS